MAYHLMFPFVVCQSEGGPYEDRAFVAGYVAGTYDQELSEARALPRYVHTDLLPQLDLLAMRHGYRMTSKTWDEDPTQSYVEFERVGD